MAYRVPNINPIDAGQNIAIGVSIPFNSPSVFNQTYTTSDQLKSNIINFLLTNPGERYLQPTYGSSLQRYLFSNITDSSYSFNIQGTNNILTPSGYIDPTTGLSTPIPNVQSYTNLGIKDIETQLKTELTLNFPTVNFQQITLTPNYDTNSVNITINYYIISGDVNTININL